MKVIPIVLPVSETIITDDTPKEDRGKRGPLAEAAMKAGDELMVSYPEVKIMMTMFYTPPEAKDVPGTYDWNHTMLNSAEGVTIHDLRDFVDVALPAMIKLRIDIENDPFLLEKLGKKQ